MLDVFQMSCIRKVLKISWRDRISTHEILRRTRSKLLSLFVFQMSCLRKLLKISWRDRISNSKILRRTRSKLLSLFVKERRLQYVGHVIRLPESRLAKVALNWTPRGGKRMRGRPKKTYRLGGTNWYQAKRTALNRSKWKDTVARCCNATGGTR